VNTAANSGRNDASMRIAIFLCFGAAALTTVAGILVGRVSPLALAFAVILSPVFVALSLWSFSGVSQGLVPLVAAVAVALIDLGLGPAQGIALGLKGIAYLLAFVSGVVALPSVARRLGPGEVLLLSLAGWSWVSAVYSVDWWVSTYTGFGLMALALIFVQAAFLPAPAIRALVDMVARVLGSMVVASVAFSLAFPHLALAQEVAGAGRYSGLFGSPNSAGGVAGLALVINLAWLAWRPAGSSRWGVAAAIAFVVASAAMMLLSGSRNAMLSLGVAALVIGAIRWPRVWWAMLAAAAVAVIVVSTLDLWGRIGDTVVGLLSRQRHGFDVRNLTGRLEIWDFVVGRWLDSPWIGHGLGGSRTVISEGFANFWGKSTGTAHNALLECLLDLGLVGAALLFSYVGWVAVHAVRAVRTGVRGSLVDNLALPVMAFVVTFGIVEKSFAGTPSTATGGLLLAGALVGALGRAGSGPRT
jgi:O-antigen ligase